MDLVFRFLVFSFCGRVGFTGSDFFQRRVAEVAE